jgi:ABC-type transport system substrate-binding protein
MDISYLPAAILRPRVWEGDFDAIFNRASVAAVTNLDIFGPDSLLGPDWRGWTGAHHVPISSLLTEATHAASPGQEDAIYEEIWEVFQEEIPLTYLFPSVLTYVIDKRVRGMSSPYRADPIVYLGHLWIEDGG